MQIDATHWAVARSNEKQARQASSRFVAAFVVATISLSSFLVSCGTQQLEQNDFGTVVQVIDGDTIVIKLQNQNETVRLIGVDTPETLHPSKPVECFGPEASAFTKATLKKGTKVKLLRDVEPRDRYSRLLVYLYLADGTFFNQLLINRGMARILNIEPNTAFANLLANEESRARNKRAGLWMSCER